MWRIHMEVNEIAKGFKVTLSLEACKSFVNYCNMDSESVEIIPRVMEEKSYQLATLRVIINWNTILHHNAAQQQEKIGVEITIYKLCSSIRNWISIGVHYDSYTCFVSHHE